MQPPFTKLTPEELAKLHHGEFLVALDAEFVAQETEPKDAGITNAANPRASAKAILKPSQLSLARVSVVRGEGLLEEEPFIDHYICCEEPPADYLTKYSGLHPGDLDPIKSRHWLTTKKTVYQKLRYLVDAGCKFVGHGLAQDFRIINMFVPSSQIIDTVELFRLPSQRLLSLKFLAARVLSINIQTETHDSVEDARTALRLYKRYLQMKEKGVFESYLTKLYDYGYRMRWQCIPNQPTDDETFNSTDCFLVTTTNDTINQIEPRKWVNQQE